MHMLVNISKHELIRPLQPRPAVSERFATYTSLVSTDRLSSFASRSFCNFLRFAAYWGIIGAWFEGSSIYYDARHPDVIEDLYTYWRNQRAALRSKAPQKRFGQEALSELGLATRGEIAAFLHDGSTMSIADMVYLAGVATPGSLLNGTALFRIVDAVKLRIQRTALETFLKGGSPDKLVGWRPRDWQLLLRFARSSKRSDKRPSQFWPQPSTRIEFLRRLRALALGKGAELPTYSLEVQTGFLTEVGALCASESERIDQRLCEVLEQEEAAKRKSKPKIKRKSKPKIKRKSARKGKEPSEQKKVTTGEKRYTPKKQRPPIALPGHHPAHESELTDYQLHKREFVISFVDSLTAEMFDTLVSEGTFRSTAVFTGGEFYYPRVGEPYDRLYACDTEHMTHLHKLVKTSSGYARRELASAFYGTSVNDKTDKRSLFYKHKCPPRGEFRSREAFDKAPERKRPQGRKPRQTQQTATDAQLRHCAVLFAFSYSPLSTPANITDFEVVELDEGGEKVHEARFKGYCKLPEKTVRETGLPPAAYWAFCLRYDREGGRIIVRLMKEGKTTFCGAGKDPWERVVSVPDGDESFDWLERARKASAAVSSKYTRIQELRQKLDELDKQRRKIEQEIAAANKDGEAVSKNARRGLYSALQRLDRPILLEALTAWDDLCAFYTTSDTEMADCGETPVKHT